MNKFFLIILALIVLSCENKTQNSNSIISIVTDTLKVEESKNLNKIHPINNIPINYIKNKDILDVILLLPDSVFQSWGWKLNDRMKWYNEIKENNFYIDDDPNYFNQIYFEPNKAGFTIIDGFWSINIYKTFENSYIVITDDVVGDGHFLNFYEVKSNKIKKYLDEKTIFSDFIELLKKKGNFESCEDKFKDMTNPIFQFDFSNKNKVEIESSWYLIKDDYKDCLIGNAIIYNFNPKAKKFEIEKIYWKPKNVE
ncbi:MAG: hypothetical protein M9916_13185 [Crocinitomicaceae bacterium]|nr:hypothetical protein [Crocinitomicaceae bacterium]